MNNPFTELVKQWREEAIRASDEDRYEAVAIIRDCADELEDYIADNKWVQITGDVYPEKDQKVLMWDGARPYHAVSAGEYMAYLQGTWYRPLNDNDYPPNSKED
ncbi:MAG: hypothetical protein DRQ40_10680 [Gammaproteobacteria bacterium]|nr:MAG: hypothetical protein DRQ40_10680 [Gammaproteobacteria bacterium]